MFLVGLIWIIQYVHYPLLDRVGVDGFKTYEADHSRMITPVVAPLMLVELATAILIAGGACPAIVPNWAAWLGLLAVVAIWASTFFIQVPCHTRLAAGFDAGAYQTLVLSNWIRTILWTGRGILLGYVLWRALQSNMVPALES